MRKLSTRKMKSQELRALCNELLIEATAKNQRIAELEEENKNLNESLTIAYMQGYSDGKAKEKSRMVDNC